MTDSFIVGAYWSSRAEALNDVKNKIIQTLQRLSKIDEQFLKWYETGSSRNEALEKIAVLDDKTIERLCMAKVKKGELDELGFSKMGFLFSLWTGHSDDQSSSISFSVGTASKWLTNSCVITLPFEGAARERLLKSNKAKEIVKVLVEIWNPEYAVLSSEELNNRLDRANELGWITYRKVIPQIPNAVKIVHEKYNEGHLFFLNGENSYDYNIINDLLQINELRGV